MKNGQEEKVSINLPADYNGNPITIEYREGTAPKLLDVPVLHKVKLEGTITAPEEYILKNYAADVVNKTLKAGIVTYSVNPNNMFIKFDECPNHPINGAVVIGKAVLNPELLAWGVNSKKSFNAKEIIAMIRSQAHNMYTTKGAKDLIDLLHNFEARFVTERKRADDRRGNTEDAWKQTLTIAQGELPTELNLHIPVFLGGDKMFLKLEIELDQVDGDVEYSFYSLEYTVLLRDTAKNAITASVDKFRETFVCIEQA